MQVTSDRLFLLYCSQHQLFEVIQGRRPWGKGLPVRGFQPRRPIEASEGLPRSLVRPLRPQLRIGMVKESRVQRHHLHQNLGKQETKN